ncbi:MAG: phycobiliprotein lyase [Aphanocapsa feldmannii 277cV]|uniref:Chromophore lyase CpcS/CpeS n=1 Tax=Aphanocapsa feldmannii 277cV TaxID=2507553 RepID=A0A524RN77_9CHRO|nr:MAG: phycobiliprotein lyase [Aphanocapsa feldmannii 288cV]TGG92255.1 MAG: phycobiliprotein lyase [Aphanocapsa feldmannii 277cV]
MSQTPPRSEPAGLTTPARCVTSTPSPLETFLQASVGRWVSERRYLALPSGRIETVCTRLTIEPLHEGDASLRFLATAHGLERPLYRGLHIHWTSKRSNGAVQTGSTALAVNGMVMLRDRSFFSPEPIQASCELEGQRLVIQLSLGKDHIEEDCRLINPNLRTRQTVVRRSGREVMLGQYLETRLS